MKTRSYSELIQLKSLKERFEYLKLDGKVGVETFGGSRMLNQMLYHYPEWTAARMKVIFRDGGKDLGLDDYPINGPIYVHHLNPITKGDILSRSDLVFDPENLICVSFRTHQAIHYGTESLLRKNEIIERKPNDTCPWR